jgi:hypothetical protein
MDNTPGDQDRDQDEAVVEELSDEGEDQEAPSPRMKQVTVEEWNQLNSQLPLWMRCVYLNDF